MNLETPNFLRQPESAVFKRTKPLIMKNNWTSNIRTWIQHARPLKILEMNSGKILLKARQKEEQVNFINSCISHIINLHNIYWLLTVYH